MFRIFSRRLSCLGAQARVSSRSFGLTAARHRLRPLMQRPVLHSSCAVVGADNEVEHNELSFSTVTVVSRVLLMGSPYPNGQSVAGRPVTRL